MPLWFASDPKKLLRDYSNAGGVLAFHETPPPITHVVDGGDDGSAAQLGKLVLYTDVTPENMVFVPRDAAARAELLALGLPHVAHDAREAVAALPAAASTLLFLNDMKGGELAWLHAAAASGALGKVNFLYMTTYLPPSGADKARYGGTPRTDEVTAWVEGAGMRRVALITRKDLGAAEALFIRPPPPAATKA